MERGRSKDPGKQERLDNYKAQFKNGKKKWVRYDEGAILYSMGIHSFMPLTAFTSMLSITNKNKAFAIIYAKHVIND